jgi:hypothetical protein
MGYDWKGWSVLFYIFSGLVATFNVVAPAELGISAVLLKWIVILSTLGMAVSAKMGSSWVGKTGDPIPPVSEAKRAEIAALPTSTVTITTLSDKVGGQP